jgi:hypothetical protein
LLQLQARNDGPRYRDTRETIGDKILDEIDDVIDERIEDEREAGDVELQIDVAERER